MTSGGERLIYVEAVLPKAEHVNLKSFMNIKFEHIKKLNVI